MKSRQAMVKCWFLLPSSGTCQYCRSTSLPPALEDQGCCVSPRLTGTQVKQMRFQYQTHGLKARISRVTGRSLTSLHDHQPLTGVLLWPRGSCLRVGPEPCCAVRSCRGSGPGTAEPSSRGV